jgi:alpha-1,2-mannosyltransferase
MSTGKSSIKGWWVPIQYWLSRKPQRIRYPFIAGGAMILAWLVSVLFGEGLMDLTGKVVGTDYLQFYTAGLTLRLGQEGRLYDFAYQQDLQQQMIGIQESPPEANSAFYAFLTPPFFAMPFVPLSLLPYGLSYAVFCLLTLVGVWLSLRCLGLDKPLKPFLWALTFFPVFANLSFGQNGVLSLAILALVYALWRSDKRLAAGLALSLLSYKPQLVFGILILWLLEARREWRALGGFVLGMLTLAGLSMWLLPESSRDYIQVARQVLPIISAWETFPLWHTVTLRGFWLLLLRWQPIAESLAGLLSLMGLGIFFIYWRAVRKMEHAPMHQDNAFQHADRFSFIYAGAVCLSAWLAPHALIYDWAILIIPAVLFWQMLPDQRDMLRALYALVWVAGFVSGPLVIAQLALLPVALHIALPVFAVCVLTLVRFIRQSRVT